MNDSEELIYYNYTGSKKQNRMSLYERSAQFAPFQALEGYMDSVKETERITKKKIELDETQKEIINEKIIYIYNNNVEGIFTYFVKDSKKSGGCYKKIKGTLKKIDEINMIVYLLDGNKISLNDIINVEY